MPLTKLLSKDHLLKEDPKLEQQWTQFQQLIQLIEERNLSDDLLNKLNTEIEKVNHVEEDAKSLQKVIKSSQNQMIRLLEKEAKIVPQGYYRNLWLALGMSTFGIPLGIILGLSMGNMGFLGIGLPIGLGIGVAVGSMFDKKAAEEGRQLAIELK